MELLKPKLELVCTLNVELGPGREMGQGRAVARRIIPVIGGTVTGAGLNGKIMNVGADWQTCFGSGMAGLDTRYAIETDGGAVIGIINCGYRDGPPEVLAALGRGEPVPPEGYDMRTHARLETSDARDDWVNRTLFVGTGARNASSVRVELCALR